MHAPVEMAEADRIVRAIEVTTLFDVHFLRRRRWWRRRWCPTSEHLFYLNHRCSS